MTKMKRLCPKNRQTFLEQMIIATEDAAKEQLRKISTDWKLLSVQTKLKLIKEIFEQVRVVMQVGEPSGPAISTFNSYRTKIIRCMIFHIGISDAHYNNRGLSIALEKALNMKGGPLRDRMKKALEECKEDPNWPGHPPRITPI